MSLGIKLLWRARPISFGVSGLSLVPRERFSKPSNQPAIPWSAPHRNASSGVTLVPADEPAEPVKKSAPRFSSRYTDTDLTKYAPSRKQISKHSILVEPHLEYPNTAETHQSKQRHQKSVSAQMRLERIRLQEKRPLADWRMTLKSLATWTPDEIAGEWQRDALEVILPEDAAEELFSGGDKSIWEIRKRNRCVVKLIEEAGPNRAPVVVLSGTESNVEAAAYEILRVAGNATFKRKHQDEWEELQFPDGAPRSLKAGGKPAGVYRAQSDRTSLEDVARPEEWTETTFLQYVTTLATTNLPSNTTPKAYPPGTTHAKAVIVRLHRVFKSEATRSSLSTAAFKRALSYMNKFGDSFRPDVRLLFVRMELFGLPMDTEVFNILLESSVKTKDLSGFDSIVRLMIRKGFTPNADTWTLLLRLIRNEDVKKYIIGVMSSKGLLRSRGTLLRVAAEMAEYDIDRALLQHKTLDMFLEEQDVRYGKRWLLRDTGNRIIDVLGRFSRFDDCFAVLDMMARHRTGLPDIVTYNTIFSHAKLQNRMDVAVETLRKMSRLSPGVVPDEITFHLLFEMAWRREVPHVLRVIWQYAVLSGQTSYRMRHRMGTLLENPKRPGKADRLLGLWRATGGSPGKDILIAARDGDKAARREVAQWYQQHFGDWRPDVPLARVVDQALAKDAELPPIEKRQLPRLEEPDTKDDGLGDTIKAANRVKEEALKDDDDRSEREMMAPKTTNELRDTPF